MDDLYYMKKAFEEAKGAAARGECPVGAVLVKDDQIISRAGNRELELQDPTAHAEILCMRIAGPLLGGHVLADCTMYSTLWPCPMCQGAMLQARIARVVHGSMPFAWVEKVRFNKGNLLIDGPVLAESCRAIFIDWARKNNRLDILQEEGLAK